MAEEPRPVLAETFSGMELVVALDDIGTSVFGNPRWYYGVCNHLVRPMSNKSQEGCVLEKF